MEIRASSEGQSIRTMVSRAMALLRRCFNGRRCGAGQRLLMAVVMQSMGRGGVLFNTLVVKRLMRPFLSLLREEDDIGLWGSSAYKSSEAETALPKVDAGQDIEG